MRIGKQVRRTGEHRLRVIAALLAISTTLLSGWPAVAEERSDAAYEAQLVVKGQELIEQHCAKCHAIGRKDTSTHQDAPPFR
ncbi:MAG: cytochrome c, partial [Pseudomonadota bacterium]